MVIAIVTTTISAFAQVKDIENNLYQTVELNKNIWMAENLNVSRFKNGDTIPEAKTYEEWENAGLQRQPAWSCTRRLTCSTIRRLAFVYN